MGYHGRASAFLEHQRLLLDVNAASIDSMVEVMGKGNCRAVLLSSWDDDKLVTVREALQQTCAEHPLLSRAHFVVVASTPDCALEEIEMRVQRALARLQFQQLDMLLLHAQTLPGTNGIHARKRAVLDAWEHMMMLQRAGLVQHIGVSDLAVQDVEFLRTAYPENPPDAWSVQIQFPTTPTTSSTADLLLEDITGFSHAHGIDVLARLPVAQLESLESQELRDEWDLLAQQIAERHRERPFKFLVAHENEGSAASFHMESHALSDTTALQTPLQIIVRYLLQKGLVVVPQTLRRQDDEMHEIFGQLAHPFAAIHPSCSPHNMYSSLLTRDDLAAIARALPLTTSFPPPAPPPTPIITTERPGSTQSRRKNMPAGLSRPPTAD